MESELRTKASAIAPSVDRRSVTITNPDLVNGLVHDQKATMAVFTAMATVSIEHIRIDALGRVVIDDPDFARELTSRLQSDEAADTNIFCAKVNIYCADAEMVAVEQ